MNLIFASNNAHKLQEIQMMLSDTIKLQTLKSVGIYEDIPEPYATFEQNAWAKASFVSEKLNQNCFAEDSGLVVPALNNEPGVFSARYAGEPSNDKNNNQKLLNNIQDIEDKRAYYQSVICLIWNQEIHYFKGKCEGKITLQPKGDNGFGYDPLFIPDGFDKTFAEFPLTEKNKISHRSKALQGFVQFLDEKFPK